MAHSKASRDVPLEYHELIIDLRDELKKVGVIDRVEYVGSMYKGTSVGTSDFDNLFVKRSDSIIAYPCSAAGFPDYAVLRENGMIVDREKKRNSYKGEVQKAINRLGMADRVQLNDSGPAIAAEYYPSGWRMGGGCLFSADLDFCLDVPVNGGLGRKLYVAKKPKGATGETKFAWKLTTDLEEKAKISTIDSGNGIGRLAVRIVKALKKKEPTLAIFKSCMFEQVLYHLKDKHPSRTFWLESNLAEVIRAMLQFIIEAIKMGVLKHYLTPENMLPTMSPATKENVLNRLQYVSKNPRIVMESA